MVLEWLSGDGGSVEELIAKKKYKKAIDLLRTEFQKGSREPRLRHQLADVLVLAGRGREAVPILAGLADELARTGFAAKAIAVLKRIDKIDPGRADVARKLAALIEAKPQAPARAEAPQDFREIGISLPPRAPAPLPTWPPPPEARTEEEPLVPGPPLPLAPVPIAPPPPVEPEAILVEPELIGDLDLSLETLVPTEAATGDVVKSPLFSDFSSAELLAVIGGLRLLTFSAGDIVITEGEPGTSLFVLTTGRVKVFVRNPAGRHVQVREMEEGEFFGEISLFERRAAHRHHHRRVAPGAPRARPRHPRRHDAGTPRGHQDSHRLLPPTSGERRRSPRARDASGSGQGREGRMKAIRVEHTGGPEVLVLVDAPPPRAEAGQALVRVEAAGLNYIDTYQRTGLYPLPMPYVPGLEGSGVVTAIGRGRFRPARRRPGGLGEPARVLCGRERDSRRASGQGARRRSISRRRPRPCSRE